MTADELKARRAALSLSQSQMAAALSTSVRTYQQWEQGRRRIPALLEVALRGVEQARKEKLEA